MPCRGAHTFNGFGRPSECYLIVQRGDHAEFSASRMLEKEICVRRKVGTFGAGGRAE